MKKIDTGKYVSICFSAIALLLLFATPPTTAINIAASLLAATGILVLILSPHKSGNLFIFTFFLAAVSVGLVVDYPFRAIPAALISFLLIAFNFNIRTFFYKQMLVSRAPWLEAVSTISVVIFFVVTAILIHYDLRQWLTASPIFFFGASTFAIFKDRNDIKVMMKNKQIETKVGTEAPDFTLSDQHGNSMVLSELLKKNHILLIFVRGDWCPTCHIMLRSYFRNKEKFAEKNVRIIGIGPDPQGVNKEIMQRIDENSVLLSDPDQETALLYAMDLQPTNMINKDVLEKGIPLPASFLVHQNGRIVHTSRSDRPGEILQPELIFNVLETLD